MIELRAEVQIDFFVNTLAADIPYDDLKPSTHTPLLN